MKTPADIFLQITKWRIGRIEFVTGLMMLVLCSYLFMHIALWPLYIFDNIYNNLVSKIFSGIWIGLGFTALLVWIFWGFFSIFIRRLHDCNKSWLNLLFIFIPYIWPLFLLIYLGLKKGDKKENKYGKINSEGLFKSIFELK